MARAGGGAARALEPHPALTAAAKVGKPAVLIVMGGGPVDVSQFKDDENVGAILW